MSVLNGFRLLIQFTHEKESKTDFHFLMYSLSVMDKVLRHVFTGNLQTETFTLIGTPLLQSSRNAAL